MPHPAEIFSRITTMDALIQKINSIETLHPLSETDSLILIEVAKGILEVEHHLANRDKCPKCEVGRKTDVPVVPGENFRLGRE